MLRWTLKPKCNAELVEALMKEINVSKATATLLIQRGITNYQEAKDFFNSDLNNLHNPFLMKDMQKAIDRIEKAKNNSEKILVFGDYDVDGTTAVALVFSFLKSQNFNCEYYIPDRYAEGYGISTKGIDYAKQNNFSLIIALDCGIKSIDKIDYANSLEIDFIICDHHLPGDEVPKAIAVLDPKQNDCKYPYKELSGCGIGYKLAQAWVLHKNLDPTILEKYIDLTAISIAADIVPITGENRILCYYGLQQVNKQLRKGIKNVVEIKNNKQLTVSDLVFVISPRINAAGRIEHGSKAVELLIADTDESAIEIAKQINTTNTNRKDLDVAITAEAIAQIENDADFVNRKSTVVFSKTWHKGVVGIVASRLVEKFYRPTIVLTEANGKVTGSARSVRNYDVYEAIEKCGDLLEQFGGHKYAAGLTMAPDKVAAFAKKFNQVVSENITDELLTPELELDLEINFNDISNNFNEVLKRFAPHGPENMNPVFLSRNVLDTGWAKVVGENHLKMQLYQQENPSIKLNAIAFGKGDFLNQVLQKIPLQIAYQIMENEYNGKTSIQLLIKELKFDD